MDKAGRQGCSQDFIQGGQSGPNDHTAINNKKRFTPISSHLSLFEIYVSLFLRAPAFVGVGER